MGSEFKVGTGLACVGLALAIGQWLIPPEAISYEVSFYIVLAAIILAVVGIGLVVHTAWVSYRGLASAQTKTKPESVIQDGYISVHEAAIRLYQAAKQGKIPMMGAETLSGGSEEDILTWWAIRITNDDDIELYGRRPPGNLEKISKRVKKDFLFVDKATKLIDPMNDKVYFTDLRIRLDQLTESYYFEAAFHQD